MGIFVKSNRVTPWEKQQYATSNKLHLPALALCQSSDHYINKEDPFLPALHRLRYILQGIKKVEAENGIDRRERFPMTPNILRRIKAMQYWSHHRKHSVIATTASPTKYCIAKALAENALAKKWNFVACGFDGIMQTLHTLIFFATCFGKSVHYWYLLVCSKLEPLVPWASAFSDIRNSFKRPTRELWVSLEKPMDQYQKQPTVDGLNRKACSWAQAYQGSTPLMNAGQYTYCPSVNHKHQ